MLRASIEVDQHRHLHELHAPLALRQTQYTVTVAGRLARLPATRLTPVSWSFTTDSTSAAICTVILAIPARTRPEIRATVRFPIDAGLKFETATPGYVTGVQFYKGASNTGTHVGHLWDASGNLLATATFTNETASGWEQVNFATAVPIAGLRIPIYVASYYVVHRRLRRCTT